MKISAINEGVSLIANIGVIASIVFLGLEMQQNTAMMQSQTRNSIVENQMSLYERGIDHPVLADVRDRISSGETLYVDVTGGQSFQYTLYVSSQLRMWENEYYQYQVGLFDTDEFAARTITWRRQIATAGVLSVYERLEATLAPDFQIYMNAIIDEVYGRQEIS